MSEFIYLSGSEDVKRAASQMSEAAHQMQQAASQIHDSLFRFLERFEQAIASLEIPNE